MMEPAQIDHPVTVADGIYWVGSHEVDASLHCNPYLVVDGDRAVLIDGGSRADFANVMMKILQAGIDPANITALIYQHYDPDLCGSMSNLIDICKNPELRILSTQPNNLFISYYIHKDHYPLIEDIGQQDNAVLLNNRRLRFINTPYAHSPGSFVTYDEATGTLFSSDLFGSFYYHAEDIFFSLGSRCYSCNDISSCPEHRPYCPIQAVYDFHRKVMTSDKALHHAMNQIRGLPIQTIAPQHGNIIIGPRDIELLIDRLAALDGVGINGIA